MKGTQLGEFEELVLLTVAALNNQAYGISIKDEIENRGKRKISIGSLHSTITRLQEKGYLESKLGNATPERGGRSKRFFFLTHEGKVALHRCKDLRDQLWNLSPETLSLKK